MAGIPSRQIIMQFGMEKQGLSINHQYC